MSTSAGEILGAYRLVRKIGSGGFANVYEALHVQLQKRVALKFLNAELVSDKNVRSRFLAEGQAASQIRHPHVVDVTDVGVFDGRPYLVMEFLDGEDLSARSAGKSGMDAQFVADVLVPVIAAVDAAHEKGVVHRDIKPGNIFLTQSPNGVHPKVVDFGIASIGDETEDSDDGPRFGTPAYMPPEFILDSKYDEYGDQYATGVLMYELLSGALPFTGEEVRDVLRKVVANDFQSIADRRDDLPEGLSDVVARAMALSPSDRYGSMAELGQAILPYASKRTRAMWEPTFGPTSDSARPPAPVVAPVAATRAEEAPVAEAQTSGPISPEAGAPPAAEEKKGFPVVPIAIAAVLGAAAIGFFVMRGPANTEGSSSTGSLAAGNGTTDNAASATGGSALGATETGSETQPSEDTAGQPEPATGGDAPSAAPYTVRLDVTPDTAKIELDGEEVGTGSFTRELARDGSTHTLTLSAEGFVPTQLTFIDAPPQENVTLTQLTTEASTGVQAAAPVGGAEGMTETTMGAEARPGEAARRRDRARARANRDRAQATAAPMVEAPVVMTAPAAPSMATMASMATMGPRTTANGAPILD